MQFLKKKLVIPAVLGAAVIASLLISGCGLTEKTNTTFPEKYILSGVDVGGKNIDETKKAIEDSLSTYSLDVSLNGYDFKIPASELGVKLNEEFDYDAVLQAANKEETANTEGMILCADEAELEGILRNYLYAAVSSVSGDETENATEPTETELALSYIDVKNKPYIKYNKKKAAFVAVDGKSCKGYDFSEAVSAIKTAVEAGDTVVSTETPVVDLKGVAVADDSTIEEALKNANEYLELDISIKFELKGYKANTDEISKKELAKFLNVQNGRDIVIDESYLAEYCSDVADSHKKSKWRSKKFQTTNSGVINITVPVAGYTLNANQLYTDISTAIEQKTSTVVNALFEEVEATNSDTVDFNGHYIELDITNQKLYVYKKGKLLVDTPVVTGNVFKGYYTPAGVYQLYTHERNRYLRGPGYCVWVDYFCAFNGGMGFHDASWVKNFSPTKYLYGGSHGCVNTPYDAVKTLYDNCGIGTYVVAYGGLTSIDPMEQEWRGKTEYTVKEGHDDLDFSDRARYGEPEYTYKSSNTKVATVNKNGKVKIKGAGTCTITITSTATSKWKAGKHVITLTVKPKTVKKTSAKITASLDTNTLSLQAAESSTANLTASVTGNGTLSYSVTSSDEALATVTISEAGVITVTAADTLEGTDPVEVTITITVKSSATSTYKAATKTLTITVTLTP